MNTNATPIDVLAEALAEERGPFHLARDPRSRAVMAVFPRRPVDVEDWEVRARAMMARQGTLKVADKPKENLLERTVVRGD